MTTEFRLPDIGEGIHEGEIVKWLVKPGDTVKEDQPLLEVMTDKVTAEIPSPCGGVVQELRGKEGEIVKVGSVIVVFGEGAASAPPAASAAPAKEKTAEAPAATNGKHPAPQGGIAVMDRPSSGGKALAAPATRKLARQMGVDLTLISGSGPRGRVTPDDVRNFSQGGGTAASSAPARSSAPALQLVSGEDRRAPFAGMRRKIAEHLVKSKQTAPHFAYVDEVDMSALVRMRDELMPAAAEQGVKLSYLPFIIKAVIAGLRQFPVLNSQLDDAKQELVYRGDFNMGIAVATNDGLIVPVIKHADQKSIVALAREIKELAEKARAGKLALDDLRGGTFTITSIGSIGGLFGVPIINYPEVGILGVNKIAKRPVVRTVDGKDEIVIADVMHLSISCDHRVVDGAEAAQFMNYVIAILQNPSRLLLEGV